MQLDLSSGELRPESLPHHLPSLGTDPSMGSSRGLQPWKSSKELSYSSKDPSTSQTLLVTVVRNPVFLRDVGKVILENYRALLIPFPVLFQN